MLVAARDQSLEPSEQLDRLTGEVASDQRNAVASGGRDSLVRATRESLAIGSCGSARSVYRHNDHRAALKRQINDLLGSHLVEEKSYQAYGEENPTSKCDQGQDQPDSAKLGCEESSR